MLNGLYPLFSDLCHIYFSPNIHLLDEYDCQPDILVPIDFCWHHTYGVLKYYNITAKQASIKHLFLYRRFLTVSVKTYKKRCFCNITGKKKMSDT